MTDPSPDQAPFVLPVVNIPPERHQNADFYRPPAGGQLSPAVIFVHGMPFPESMPPPRTWPVYIGYGTQVAARGAVGVVIDHAPQGRVDYAASAELVAGAVESVRLDPGIDQDRIALWFFSGGGPLCSDYLRRPPAWLRCVALTYPVLGEYRGPVPPRFNPATAVRGAGKLPILLTRAGLERAGVDATVAQFLPAYEARAEVETIEVPHGQHGFDMLDHTEESRRAVDQGLSTVLKYLE